MEANDKNYDLYTGGPKSKQPNFVITASNIDQRSKHFHRHTQKKIKLSDH